MHVQRSGNRVHGALAWPAILLLLGLACQGRAQDSGLRAATGGVSGRLVVLPSRGSGLYSWALPVTVGGLLKQAQVDATSAEVLAALLKERQPGAAGSGLPPEWAPNALQEAADAGQVGKQQGYVLVASWNTSERSQEKWNDSTPFWLMAKLQRGTQVLFDTTRLPREAGKFYRLADYDTAARDLADVVVQNINPGALERARRGDLWRQHGTLEQVRCLAEAEQDIAAGRLEDARAKLADASATGVAGTALALQLLVEVNAALCRQSPERANDIGRQAEQAGRALEAQGAKTQAWAGLSVAEGLRLQGKWREAGDEYVSWVQFLIDQSLMQPDEIIPAAVRPELDARKPRIWDRLSTPALEAEWWATVGLALYRGVSDPLVAQTVCTHAEERANADPDEKSRATALSVLAVQAGVRSDTAHALEWQQKALAIREHLAPGSLDCAVSCNSLANVYYALGDLDRALEWYQKALTIHERLAPNSLAHAASYNNVGAVAVARGDLDGALRWYRKALAIRERLEPGSPDCATMYNNIGVACISKGDYPSATEWYQKARAIYERLTPGSLDCGMVYNNLGALYFYESHPDDALQWHQKARVIYERLAPASLAVAASYTNLGGVYAEKGDLDVALEWDQKALAIKERLAPGSLACAVTYDSLGNVWFAKDDPDRALGWCLRAVAIYERLAPDSVGCATSYSNLANVYAGKNDPNRALELDQKALAIYERAEPGSLDCARVYRNVGDTYLDQGNLDGALERHQKALDIYVRLAPDSAQCAAAYSSLADVYARKLDLEGALERRQKALAILERSEPNSDRCTRTAAEVGLALLEMGKGEEARRYLTRGAAKTTPGDWRQVVFYVLIHIGQRRLDVAKPIIEEVCTRGEKALAGVVDPNVERFAKQWLDQGDPEGYYLLGRVWQAAGERAKATGAYDTFLKAAKPDHPWRADAEARRKQFPAAP